MAKFKIGILETGRPPEELEKEHISYPHMVENLLSRIDAEFSTYAVLDNQFPTSADICDLWVITGSKFGAYEDHKWIKPLEEFIRNIKAANKLMFGICFGHQLIAQALGGKVKKYNKGWALGINQYQINNWPQELGDPPTEIALQAYHQDQITTLPEGAITVASSDFCKYAAVWYPDFGLTVQGHPEFSNAYASALLKARRGNGLTEQEADYGLANMVTPDNRETIAKLVETYLTKWESNHA
ncbi:MAG: type 1 glutamine amidotransferase [Alphaproteobacteria bacterium]|nr:type 1 glutamine amidotransferase [Alphaproteobacteria bacterium]